MKDRAFLIWLHMRLTEIKGENPNADYMMKLRAIIQATDKDKDTPNVCSRDIEELLSEVKEDVN